MVSIQPRPITVKAGACEPPGCSISMGQTVKKLTGMFRDVADLGAANVQAPYDLAPMEAPSALTVDPLIQVKDAPVDVPVVAVSVASEANERKDERHPGGDTGVETRRETSFVWQPQIRGKSRRSISSALMIIASLSAGAVVVGATAPRQIETAVNPSNRLAIWSRSMGALDA